jgi:PAS domain S-box-containing protein
MESDFQELRLIHDHASVGIAKLTPEGHFLQVNAKLCDILGYAAEELLTKTFAEVTHPEARSQVLQWASEFVDGTRSHLDVVKRFVHKQGHNLWMRVVANGVRDARGKLEHFVSVFEDHTEKRASEDLLRSQKEVLELMVRNLPLNSTLARIVMMIEEQAPGCQSTIYLVEDGRLKLGAAPSMPESFLRTVNGCPIGPSAGSCGAAAFHATRIISTDIEAATPESEPCWGQFKEWILSHGIKAAWSTPVISEDGRVIGTVSMCWREPKRPTPRHFELVDVAVRLMGIAIERDRTHRLLQKQQMQMIASSKLAALGEMAAGLAHEINNPLAIIQGRAEQLKLIVESRIQDPELLRDISLSIQGTTRRISKIIRGLKTFARDAENEPFESVAVGSIVEDTLQLCRERFKNSAVDLRLGPVPKELALLCRPVQVSQVLLNLLNNSNDAIEKLADRWVAIGIEDRGNEISIAVEDSGPGIPEGLRGRIMEPFFTTKDPNRGTGLGLSISIGIAEGHGGRLALDPDAPHTRFVLSLPKAQGSPR